MKREAATAEHSAAHAARARRRSDLEAPRAPDGRQKLLEAAERLLADSQLADLTVARISAEAAVSRATFYLHFDSKFDVVVDLLTDIMGEMYELLNPLTAQDANGSREAAIREVLTNSAELWDRHSAVFRATHESFSVVPEIRAKWLAFTEHFIDALADAFGDELPDAGPAESRRICATLVWATEHMLYVAGSDLDRDLSSTSGVADTLTRMWVGTLYGSHFS